MENEKRRNHQNQEPIRIDKHGKLETTGTVSLDQIITFLRLDQAYSDLITAIPKLDEQIRDFIISGGYAATMGEITKEDPNIPGTYAWTPSHFEALDFRVDAIYGKKFEFFIKKEDGGETPVNSIIKILIESTNKQLEQFKRPAGLSNTLVKQIVAQTILDRKTGTFKLEKTPPFTVKER